ncbi:AzlD domain-containing protein [Streptomyces lydicus]|uniref:AzlD domain-containing protein n=1 Tax=Streptomyces lydicus TaxID=47763 RepID=UPI0037D1685B
MTAFMVNVDFFLTALFTVLALAAILVTAAVTWALRAVPFAARAPLRASATVQYLSTRMPAGVMVIQVVSCLHDLPGPHVRVLAPSPPRPSPSHCTCGAATRC